MTPHIDVVIIGLNSAKTLQNCIDTVKACHYSSENISLYYADGGSTDDSRKIAKESGAVVIDVIAESPTPGRQRNSGWQAGSGEFVQFLDSDTLMDRDWLSTAVVAFSESIGAVCGNRSEIFPEQSVFNWLGNQEWNGKAGEAEAFGGDVMITRKALSYTGGYNSELIAGEDPELSYRIRKAGFRILKLDTPMTRHDLAMLNLRQYWKRAYRTGHAYAEVNSLHPDLWNREILRIKLRTGFFILGICALPAAFFLPWLLFIPFMTTLLLLRPRILLVDRFKNDMSLTKTEAKIYAWHASLVVVPQFFGVIRYGLGRLFGRPLTNKKILNMKNT